MVCVDNREQVRGGELSLDRILSINDLENRKSKTIVKQIEDIFFESSVVQSFASLEAKEKFLHKYLGIYIQDLTEGGNSNTLFKYACLEEQKVLGYICGNVDTLKNQELFKLLPFYHLLEEELREFPSHLHINCSSTSRGMGVGKALVKEFEMACGAKGAIGLHLITNPKNTNVQFYRKQQFLFEKTFEYKDSKMIFMAKKL